MTSSLNSASSRISVPEGYTEIPLDWNDGTGDKLYVYINPNLTSQPIYIGSDENTKITDRQRVIQFTTTNSNSGSTLNSTAELTVIQSETVVSVDTNELYYSIDGGTEKLLTKFSNSEPFDINLPSSVGIGSSVSFKVYTLVTINGEPQYIQRYINNTYNSNKGNFDRALSVKVSHGVLTVSHTNPMAVTGTFGVQITNISIDSFTTDEGYLLPQIVNNELLVAGAPNMVQWRLSNLQVEYDPLILQASGETLTPNISFQATATYSSGFSQEPVTYTYQQYPYLFDVIDSTLSSNASFDDCNVVVSKATTVYGSNKEVARFKVTTQFTEIPLMGGQLTSEEIVVYQGPNIPESIVNLNLSLSTLSWMVPYSDGNTEVFWFNKSDVVASELPLPAGGVTNLDFHEVYLNFDITLSSGLTTSFILSKEGDSELYRWIPDVGAPTIEDLTVFDKWALNFMRSFGSSGVPSTLLTVASKGTTVSDETTVGTILLQMHNIDDSTTDWTFSNHLTVTQEANSFLPTTLVNSNIEYPDVPAKGGTINPSKVSLRIEGSFTSGSSSLVDIDVPSNNLNGTINQYLVTRYNLSVSVDELVSANEWEELSGKYSPFPVLSYPSCEPDDTTQYLSATRFMQDQTSWVIRVANTGTVLGYTDSCDIYRAPNRFVITKVDSVYFLEAFSNRTMPAIGGDITQDILKQFTLSVTGYFEENPNTSIPMDIFLNNAMDYPYTLVNGSSELFPLSKYTLNTRTLSDNYNSYRTSTSISEGIIGANLKTTSKEADVNFIDPGSIQLSLPILSDNDTSSVICAANSAVVASMSDVNIGGNQVVLAWGENTSHNYSDTNVPILYYQPAPGVSAYMQPGLGRVNGNPPQDNFDFNFTYRLNSSSIGYITITDFPAEGGSFVFRLYNAIRNLYNTLYVGNWNAALDKEDAEDNNNLALVTTSSNFSLDFVTRSIGFADGSYTMDTIPQVTIEPNTTGKSRSITVNIYNNNNTNAGRGSVITLDITQLG